jgi:hypothetical protein
LWRDLDFRLSKNVSNLCAAVGSDDHLYVVGDVMGKLDLKTEEWKSLPLLFVSFFPVTLRNRDRSLDLRLVQLLKHLS